LCVLRVYHKFAISASPVLTTWAGGIGEKRHGSAMHAKCVGLILSTRRAVHGVR
jgi:hypothetical protein